MKVLTGINIINNEKLIYYIATHAQNDTEIDLDQEEESDAAYNIVDGLSLYYIKKLLRNDRIWSNQFNSIVKQCIKYTYEGFVPNDKKKAKYFSEFDIKRIDKYSAPLPYVQEKLGLLYRLCSNKHVKEESPDKIMQVFRENKAEIYGKYMKQILIDNAKTASEESSKALWGDRRFMYEWHSMSHVKFFLRTIYPILLSRFKNWNIDQIILTNDRRIEFYLDHDLKIRRNRLMITKYSDNIYMGKLIIPDTTYKLSQFILTGFISKNLTKLAGYFVS